MGWGIRPEDFGILKWRKSYKVVIGLFKGKEIDSLISLKKYQMHKYKFIPERDYMIMANPWGDGNVYNNLCEKFVLKELEGCYKFGITHYQIDDGWQGGGKAIDIINNKFIDKKFWKVDKNRFPHSFYKISERAKKLGITLGLWFVPNRNNQYKNYLQDVETILDFYKKFGIKVFKLDAINIQTKEIHSGWVQFIII
jgi:alpha-galactosidase